MRTATHSRRQALPGIPKPPPAELLKPLEGTWFVEGKVFESPYGPAATWRSQEHTEWLWGRRFLLLHWRARLDERPFEGLTVLGQDEDGSYFAQLFDNGGHSMRYGLQVRARHWRVTGAQQRAHFRFSVDGRTIAICWEWREGHAWKPLCDRLATRIPEL